MRPLPLLVCLSLAVCSLGTPAAGAQDADRPEEQAVQLWPTTDVFDLWHRWRTKDEPADEPADNPLEPSGRPFVLAPGISARPSTGVMFGLNGNLAFRRGGPASTHLSTAIGGFRVSQKKQVLSNVRFAVFTPDDGWLLRGDHRVNWMSLDTYALGTNSNSGTLGASNVKFHHVRLQDTAYRGVGAGFFVGGGFTMNLHRNIRTDDSDAIFDRSAYVAYTGRHGFAADHQLSTGTNVGVLYDSRDNAINAAHGWLASAAYDTYFKGLGGDATWQQLSVDVRTFRPLTRTGSHLIAAWLLADLITGGVAPYLDLPTIGGDVRSGRGYAEGRYRGERLVYGELEYRGSLTRSGLVGIVGFVNTTTVANEDAGTKLFDAYAPAAGFGFRVLLNKRTRTNLCADWGWGKEGSRGFYLGLQEAF
jgi:surface antigen Omp85-like protein